MKHSSTLVLCTLIGIGFTLLSRAEVIVDDTFADGMRTNLPFASNNSLWYDSSSTGMSLTNYPGYLLGLPTSANRVWLAYFTDSSVPIPPPRAIFGGNTNAVDLAVNQLIRVTVTLTPTNTRAWDPNAGFPAKGLRVGLLDFADGGARVNSDTNAISITGVGGIGTNVLGYMTAMPFYTTFSSDTPIEIRARVDTNSPNLIGSTSAYIQIDGSGPAGLTNQPAFVSGLQYQCVFSVAHYASSNVITVSWLGPGLGGLTNVTWSVIDTTNHCSRFDTFAIRTDNVADTADSITISEFKVERLPAGSQLQPFSITSSQVLPSGQFSLTWASVANQTYQIQSQDTLGGSWTTNATLTAGSTTTSWTNAAPASAAQRFYRVAGTP